MLHGHIWGAAMLISGASLIGACLLAESLLPFSGLLMSTMAYFYLVVGMETSLLLFLILLALNLFRMKRYAALHSVLVLCLLTRAEAGALIPVIGWLLFKKRELPRMWTFVPAIILLLVYFAINHHFYGSFVPSSSIAKLSQGRSGYWGNWPRAFIGRIQLSNMLNHVFHYDPFSLLFLVIAAPFGVRKIYPLPWVRVALLFAAILLAFYIGFNLPNYYWYYAPFIVLLTLFAVAAVPPTVWGTAFIWSLAVLQAASCAYAVQQQEARIQNYDAIAAWINEHSAPTVTIEAAEIGELAVTSHRKIDDIIGLTEPKNAAHISHHDISSWLQEDRPDYVIVHKPAWIFEQVAIVSPDYTFEPFHSGDVYILKRKTTGK